VAIDAERRARLALQLANNELLPLLFAERREEIAKQILETEPTDYELREGLYLEARTLDNLSESFYSELRQYNGK